MAILLILSLIATSPVETFTTNDVDIIEVNHVYGIEHDGVKRIAVLRFSQIILWKWMPDYGNMHATYWCKFENTGRPKYINGKWTLIWQDGNHLRKVSAQLYQELSSTYDREVRDRDFVPQQYRTGLVK